MKRLTIFACVLAFGATMLLLAGCGKSRPSSVAPRPQGKLAIVGFTQPTTTAELLAGYLPDEQGKISTEVFQQLDASLQSSLNAHGVMDYTPAAVTKQCQDVVLLKVDGMPRMSALSYWLKVGECMTADYILVPQVLQWVERDGGEMGVKNPASVTVDLFLIDVKQHTLLRGHYSETQQDLSENLLAARKFFKRGAKWVSALELAKEGIDEKLVELGL